MPLTSAEAAKEAAHSDLRSLAALSAAGITSAGLLLIAIIAYAGWASNYSSTLRERTQLKNAIERGIARTLNEQKSVAWWDDAVVKSTGDQIDLEFADSEFGVFLSETYGHDEIYILNDIDQPIYAFGDGGRKVPDVFETRRPQLAATIAELRRAPRPGRRGMGLKSHPDEFGAEQSNYRTIGGPVDKARWVGHLLKIDGQLAIVAALSIVPNVDMSLLREKPSIVVSILYVDTPFVEGIGRALLLPQLAISLSAVEKNGTVSEPLLGDEGALAGYLTWKTEQPGQVLLQVILPLVAVGVLATAVLASGMIRRLQDSSKELALRELQSRHDASHDALSALANRSYFAEQLSVALADLGAAQGEHRAVVAYIDVDHFKDVNDTLGHHAGDELIKSVAQRLSEQMRADSLLSRYGGDEFAILWPEAGPNAGEALAKRIQKAFMVPFEVGGQSLVVTASAGIATSSKGSSVDEVMRQADIALYEAKSRGRNRAVFFSDEMARQVEERRAIELDLRAALEQDLLRLNYQPIIATSTGGVSGVEALLRWRHPVRGNVPPAVFIPIAEQCGLMPALGEWVLSRAMKEAAGWPHLQVSVNLSPVQFRHDDLVSLLKELVTKHAADPSRFVLEITEGVLMDSSDRTSKTLDAIHAMGFLTALDDFGTGYSSLSYLCNFRFDKIKIDRSFVSGMSKSETYAQIVRAVVALGNGLGMKLVAEGVETETEAAAMAALGCGELQGYYFSRPLEADALQTLLANYVPKLFPMASAPIALQTAAAGQ